MRHLSATISAKNTLWMCVALAAAILAAWLVVVLGTPTKRAEAAFPGNNGKIAFGSRVNLTDQEIVTMKPNGDNKTQLTNNGLSDSPTFSPNGKMIAFASEGIGEGLDIFTMSANGTDKKNVTRSPSPDSYPAWSPDGTKIAFAGKRGTDRPRSIFVMKAKPESETNRPKQLTGSRFGNFEPDWQPLP